MNGGLRLHGAGGGIGGAQTFGNEPAPIPEVFNGVVFGDVTVPASVVTGQSFTVSGTLGFDCPFCAVDRATRVLVEASHLQEPIIQQTGDLSGRGETSQFSVPVPGPQSAGQTVTVRVKGQRNPPGPADWSTDNTAGPFQINAVTQQEKTVQNVVGVVPWVIGGSAIGAGGAHLLDEPVVAGGAVGAGAGVTAKVLGGQFEGDVVPSFPTGPVLALTALLGAGGLLLAAPGFTAGQIGEVAGLAE